MFQHPSDWHNNTGVIRALMGMREPRFVELNNEIPDNVASRIYLAKLHDQYVR
jgi:hypothetical protein